MSKQVDFRLVKPKRRINKHTNKIEYEIPCIVVKIGKLYSGNKYEIEVEHVDFLSGKMVRNTGFTYAKTIDIFNSLNLEPPFDTACRVKKISKNNFQIIVYGKFNAGLVEKMYDVGGILNDDETQIIDVFQSHYKELVDWLVKCPSNISENSNDDLPF